MSFRVYTTEYFQKELKKLSKKYPSIKSDFELLIQSLKENPKQGEPLGKDCFKVRMSIQSKGKGKSGGSRVITCVKVVNESIFLLSVYNKSDKETLADSELDFLLSKIRL